MAAPHPIDRTNSVHTDPDGLTPGIGSSSRDGVSPLKLIGSLRDGEQLRFHVDVGRCIGCNACMVACSEQHGNPADLFWRRVGEFETGTYPDARRLFVSMACNQCLEPACLEGCPSEAYVKDPRTGVVRHLEDACIGCQYCVWNCPYSVPVYDSDRHVVTKCDMSLEEMMNDQWPACVAVCPTNALAIEAVAVGPWKEHHESGDLPGLPPAALTLSTTRFSMPDRRIEAESPEGISGDPAATGRGRRIESSWDPHAVRVRVAPQHAHLSLVVFTVLTQMAVGSFAMFALEARENAALAGGGALGTPLAIALFSMMLAPLHLGRPLRAYRAVLNWKRSWLSREILALGGFVAAAAASFTLRAFDEASLARVFDCAATALGLAGVYCTARIYRVPARPTWDSPRTTASFLLTSLLLGAGSGVFLVSWLAGNPSLSGSFEGVFRALTVGSATALIAMDTIWLMRMRKNTGREIQASLSLLLNRFINVLALRMALLLVGGVLLPIGGHPSLWTSTVGLAMVLTASLFDRYLFFVTVVPMGVPGAVPGTPFKRA